MDDTVIRGTEQSGRDGTAWPAMSLLLALAALAGMGCWPRYRTSYRPPEPQTVAERNFEVVWQAARDVLRDHDFELDRQDRRAGVITTDALVGQHFFEVWRKDAASLYTYSENSVQTIFRAAKVTITPVEGSDKFDFAVQVAVARSDKGNASETAELTDASQAMVLHGGVDTTRSEEGQQGINARLKYEDLLPAASPSVAARMPVVPLGFDNRLEQLMEHEIRVAATGYVYTTPQPVRYTDPGELIPSAPQRPSEPALPNPALPAVPPAVPNPAGDDDSVQPRLFPADVDAPERPQTPTSLEAMPDASESPAPPVP